MRGPWGTMTAVGFEPTHPKIVELESTALDHSAKLSILQTNTNFINGKKSRHDG